MRRLAAILAFALLAPAGVLWAQDALFLFERIRAGDEQALSALRQAAEKGDADSQFQLGRANSHGSKILPRDDTVAAQWVEKAAQQGHVEAQQNMGFLYSAGMGVPRSGEQALAWWRKAAEKGYAPSQHSLGVALLQGKLVQKDEAEARAWLAKAAEQALPQAQSMLAYTYLRGIGGEKDAEKAVLWYRKAAEQGDQGAMFALGMLYVTGDGVPRDHAIALSWLRKPGENGHAAAIVWYSQICNASPGVCERSPNAKAGAFHFDVMRPRVRIIIPGLPDFPLEPHPLAKAQPHVRFMGSKQPYILSILTPTADAGMTAAQCANSSASALMRRFGLSESQVQLRKADDATYVATFHLKEGRIISLKAFLWSAAGGTHCVELNVSKIVSSLDELEAWPRVFESARIESY